ncbi:hypothetical protein ACXPVS_13435 [Pseudomonas sp. Ma2-10]
MDLTNNVLPHLQALARQMESTTGSYQDREWTGFLNETSVNEGGIAYPLRGFTAFADISECLQWVDCSPSRQAEIGQKRANATRTKLPPTLPREKLR